MHCNGTLLLPLDARCVYTLNSVFTFLLFIKLRNNYIKINLLEKGKLQTVAHLGDRVGLCWY